MMGTGIGERRWACVCIYLCDFPLIACVGAGAVVSKRLGAGELVVGRRCGNDVALGCNLAGEAGDRASYC